MSDLTAEVRAALAAATPGPWKQSRGFPAIVYGADRNDIYSRPREEIERNVRLIASAPSWLAALCDRLDAAEAKYERLRCILGGDGPFACCECCPDDDPAYHAENPPNPHDLPCNRCSGAAQVSDLTARADAAEAKLAAVRELHLHRVPDPTETFSIFGGHSESRPAPQVGP